MATNNPNTNTCINNYDNDTGSFDDNNISQHVLCTSRYMHITPHNYLLCIPRIPYTATKMDLARAVENQIISSGKGKSTEIENFKYVKNVTFIRAFDQFDFDQLRATRLNAEVYGFETSCSASAYGDPWYKIAFVNVDIPPHYTENEIEFYTNGEDAFYNGVCRGDIVINSWPNAFFVAHPGTYFQQQEQQQQQPKKIREKPRKNRGQRQRISKMEVRVQDETIGAQSKGA